MALSKKPVNGMKDILPAEMEIRDYVTSVIKDTYRSFGFTPIETPCMENIANLSNKQGGENEKLIFKVLKRGEKLNLETAKEEADVVDFGSDAAVVHVDGAVGECREMLVVGDDDKGLPELLPQLEEELVQFLLVLRVETARGFIGEDDRGMVHERPGHGDALFLAAREFVGLVAGPVLQSHEGEQFRGPFLGSLGAGAGDIGRNHDVLDS